MDTVVHSAAFCASCMHGVSEHAVFCPHCGTRQPGKIEQTDYEYAAFISYRHSNADSKIAAKVQEAIETYRFPKDVKLPGSGTSAGASHVLGKCFRDEDELAAASSLPDSIRSALKKSRALVVVCSSRTPESTWIEREIVAFCEMHGRDRIFTVLVDGTSKKCIPRILLTRTVMDVDGKPHDIPAEPLAADYRSKKDDDVEKEKLRILAAVAGCNFDDLRQRDRERARKQRTKRILFIAIALLVVAGLSAFGFLSFRNAQSEESKKLTVQSQRQLVIGDRYGAIESALQALPSSEAAVERPLVKEAKQALEEALEINLSTQFWRASYVVEDKSDIVQMVVSEKDGWFATMDESLNITVRDALTGSVESRFNLLKQQKMEKYLESDIQADSWKIEASGPYLIAAERAGSGLFTAFEAKRGKRIRYTEGMLTQSIIKTDDDKRVILVLFYGDTIGTTIEDVTMDLDKPIRGFELPGHPDPEGFIPVTPGKEAGAFYMGIGNTVVHGNVLSGDVSTYMFPQERNISSIRLHYHEGPDGETSAMVVTASRNPYGGDPNSSDYRKSEVFFDAFDSNLNQMWTFETTDSMSFVGEAFNEKFVDSPPEIHGQMDLGTSSLACSVGKQLLVLSPTGELLFSRTCKSPIVDAGVFRAAGYPDLVFVSLANRFVECYDPTDRVFANRAELELSDYTNLSFVGQIEDDSFILISQSQRVPNCVVSFHVDMEHFSINPDAESTERSLSELVTEAHKILDSIAQ